MGQREAAFGRFVKNLRIRNDIGLREFCKRVKVDPSNWSKVERGIIPAPKKDNVLELSAETLRLERGSDEREQFFDLAALSQNSLPPDLTESEFVGKLPAFFRTIRKSEVTESELDKIIETIRTAHQP